LTRWYDRATAEVRYGANHIQWGVACGKPGAGAPRGAAHAAGRAASANGPGLLPDRNGAGAGAGDCGARCAFPGGQCPDAPRGGRPASPVFFGGGGSARAAVVGRDQHAAAGTGGRSMEMTAETVYLTRGALVIRDLCAADVEPIVA